MLTQDPILLTMKPTFKPTSNQAYLYYEEASLSDIPLGYNNQTLYIALIAAFLIHLVFLYYWKIDPPDRPLFPTLNFKLMPKAVKDTPLIKPVENVKDLAKDLVKKVTEDTKHRVLDQNIEVPRPSNTKPMKEKNTPPPSNNLYEKAIHTIRQGLLPKTPVYKSFGVSDFPQKAPIGDPYSAPSSIPVLITSARTVSFVDNQGYGMIMKDDGKGNVRCLQQRPGAGTEGPMWYPVPASMCGHLR